MSEEPVPAKQSEPLEPAWPSAQLDSLNPTFSAKEPQGPLAN